MSKYRDYRHAEDDLREMVLMIQDSWLKIAIQLESVREIWNVLDPRLRDHYYQICEHLQVKLQTALIKVDSIIGSKQGEATVSSLSSKHMPVKKLQAVFLKDSIKKAIDDLESWQSRFDPSWYLMIRHANPAIDRHLEGKVSSKSTPTRTMKEVREAIRGPAHGRSVGGSIFIDPGRIQRDTSPIPWSNACMSHYSGQQGAVLVDKTGYPSNSDLASVKTHVRDMARLLSKVDPWIFGLLSCHGVIEETDQQAGIVQFQFVFDIPQELMEPRSLRDMILESAPHSLDQRFRLAKQLARSVMFVHTSGFVHKNIRPETIVVFRHQDSTLNHTFLLGFERFRPVAAHTSLQGDSRWETNLYRHPRRQGICPEDHYIMQHDIYSLGICLLEVGLWQSFVRFDGASVEPALELSSVPIDTRKDPVKEAYDIKRTLASIASSRLPNLMGTRYTKLVMSCLNCLDPEETNIFGTRADLEDEDGIIVGVQYIEKVSISSL
ncbi:MAG: hypothetical protein Q9160_003424 [Pyrenula sp. 1 TL-2023]